MQRAVKRTLRCTGLIAAALALALLCGQSAAIAAEVMRFSFALTRSAGTSAGVFEPDGRLIRTLWRGEPLPAGDHVRSWDGLDDRGQPLAAGLREIRVIQHNITYRWEGVVGNSSAPANGMPAHKAFLPPTSVAMAGAQVFYTAGYNEQQPLFHGFRLDQPGSSTRPAPLVDPFAAASMVATDGSRLYWANTGGLARTSFVGAIDLATREAVTWSAGQSVCLNQRPSGVCYDSQDHRSVIDVHADESWAATGIAVQANGRVLAVAHGAQNRINLFDKTSGAALGSLSVPMAAKGLNQIAMAPNGDLWVIAATGVQRFTRLDTNPTMAASLIGLVRPIAIAVSPTDNDVVWVADGGNSQQLKRLNRNGSVQAVLGQAGGYATDPFVSKDKMCFNVRPALEWTGIAVAADESVLAIDACNNRMLRFFTGGHIDVPVAYLPASYASTVDHGNPTRVFANFLEFEVDTNAPLVPGASWRLVRNWLAGLPAQLQSDDAFNAGFGGFSTVETLSNGRTYGVLTVKNRQAIVELPTNGPLRFIRFLVAPPTGNPTPWVLYENGELGYAITSSSAQTVLRLALTGFDNHGNPQWASEPNRIASVPLSAASPHYRGSFSGPMGPRFPLTSTGKVVFFDGSVKGNEGFHLGATLQGGTRWLWQASPSGAMDGRGSFQTHAIDASIQYGGNAVWAHDRHVLYGYHGEFYKDLQNGKVGQANQFMHFYDNGLFIGQFGQPSTRPGTLGLSGNAFSPTLVRSGDKLFLYHNDESAHGGVHRWRIEGWNEVQELRGSGGAGSSIVLR